MIQLFAELRIQKEGNTIRGYLKKELTNFILVQISGQVES